MDETREPLLRSPDAETSPPPHSSALLQTPSFSPDSEESRALFQSRNSLSPVTNCPLLENESSAGSEMEILHLRFTPQDHVAFPPTPPSLAPSPSPPSSLMQRHYEQRVPAMPTVATPHSFSFVGVHAVSGASRCDENKKDPISSDSETDGDRSGNNDMTDIDTINVKNAIYGSSASLPFNENSKVQRAHPTTDNNTRAGLGHEHSALLRPQSQRAQVNTESGDEHQSNAETTLLLRSRKRARKAHVSTSNTNKSNSAGGDCSGPSQRCDANFATVSGVSSRITSAGNGSNGDKGDESGDGDDTVALLFAAGSQSLSPQPTRYRRHAILAVVALLLFMLALSQAPVLQNSRAFRTVATAVRGVARALSPLLAALLPVSWHATVKQAYLNSALSRAVAPPLSPLVAWLHPPHAKVVFTEEKLARCNGVSMAPDEPETRKNTLTYVAVLGHVFDVGEGLKYYARGGAYNHFAGYDHGLTITCCV